MKVDIENLNPNQPNQPNQMDSIEKSHMNHEFIDNDHDDSSKNIRVTCSIKVDDQFTLSSTKLHANSHLQYSDIYRARIDRLGPACKENCMKKWPKEKECLRIAGLSSLINSDNDDVDSNHVKHEKKDVVSAIAWVVGTIYMDLPLKECVLDEITREQWISAPPSREKYIDESQDKVILEDESGRVTLSGKKLSGFLLCTGILYYYYLTHIIKLGMVVGVLGRQLVDGTFSVIDICFPVLEPQRALSNSMPFYHIIYLFELEQEESWIAFVSGLDIGSEGSMDFKLQLLSDWITGELGDKEVWYIFLTNFLESILCIKNRASCHFR